MTTTEVPPPHSMVGEARTEDATLSGFDALFEEAGALQAGDVSGIMEVLEKASSLGLTPGRRALLQLRLGKATKLPKPVLEALEADHANTRGGAVLHTPALIAEAALAKLRELNHEVVVDEGALYHYGRGEGEAPEAGFFERDPVEALGDFVKAVFGELPALKVERDVKETVRLIVAELEQPGYFRDAARGVCAGSKFLAVDEGSGTVEVRQHSPNHKARFKVDVEYDPDAQAPEFHRGLERVLPDPQARQALGEFGGCAILGVSPARDLARNALLLAGDRNSGKSTIVDLLRGFFPDDLVCAIPPQDWGSDYNRAAMRGNALNSCTELGSHGVNAERFKGIVSLEPVSARFAFGRPFTFTPTARHLFSTNALPSIRDEHDAVERRLLCIPFNNGLQAGQVDPEFRQKMAAERQGIFAWFVGRGVEALRRRAYTIPMGHREIITVMQHGEPQLVEFAAQRVEKAPQGAPAVPARDLQAGFRRFLSDKGEDASDVSEVTGARKRAAILKSLYGAEPVKINGTMHYRGIRMK